MVPRAASLVCLVLVAAAHAGCGDSVADRRAEWRTWSRAADAVCRRTQARLVQRGGAAAYEDIERIASRARIDIRAATAELRRIPRPEGVDVRARPFLAAVQRIDPALGRLIEAAGSPRADREIKAAEALREEAFQFEFQSRKAGMRVCGAGNQRDDAVDALTAPAFATLVARFHVLLFRKVKQMSRSEGATPTAAARTIDRISVLIEDAVALYGRLRAPRRASFAAQQYSNALSTMARSIFDLSAALKRRPVQLSAVRRASRVAAAAGRRADQRFAALERALAAIAPAKPGAGSKDDPAAPVGGDDQADA